jgi:hypothetical protein
MMESEELPWIHYTDSSRSSVMWPKEGTKIRVRESKEGDHACKLRKRDKHWPPTPSRVISSRDVNVEGALYF